MFSSKFIVLPADRPDLIAHMLGGLDPNQSATVTFRTVETSDIGIYVLEFQQEQIVEGQDADMIHLLTLAYTPIETLSA